MTSASTSLQYSDFFLLTILPIIIQAAAVVYLWKIHKFIGKEMTLLLAGINGILLLYDITISYLLLMPPDPDAVDEGIEGWGLFIGFVMPMANAIMHFILQRRLAKSFDYKTMTDTLLRRNDDRDRTRDMARDPTRDIARDSQRDVVRDSEKDRTQEEEGEEEDNNNKK